MKTGKKSILLCLMVIFISLPVRAKVHIKIDIQPEFRAEDTIYFNYSLSSDKNEQVNYSANINCPDAPLAMIGIKNVSLEKDSPFFEEYHFDINKHIEPQICTASVSISEPFELTERKEFRISSSPSLLFGIIICKDESCSKKTRVFAQEERIYLDYSSEVTAPSITAILTLPDESTEQITMPTSVTPTQTGTYTLEATASKEGYKTTTKKEQFAVIEKHAEITDASECNADGICNNEENRQNCPQDCIEEAGEPKTSKPGYLQLLWFVITILVIAAVVLLLLYLRNRSNV